MASTWINWPSTVHDMVLILSQDHSWTQATKARTRMEGHMQNSLGRCAQRKKSELINNIRHCFILYSHSATFKAWTLASAKLFINTLSTPPIFVKNRYKGISSSYVTTQLLSFRQYVFSIVYILKIWKHIALSIITQKDLLDASKISSKKGK